MTDRKQKTQQYNLSYLAAVVHACLAALLSACDAPEPVSAERFAATDDMIQLVDKNIAATNSLQKVTDIDHSRLGAEAGSPMAPSRVIIFSDPQLNSRLLAINPLTGLDLPFRVLAYEDRTNRSSKFVYNSFDYILARYKLDPAKTDEIGADYEQGLTNAVQGLPANSFAPFNRDDMETDGIITIKSPYSFEETIERVNAAIDAQSDTMHFGVVDFQEEAAAQGIAIPRSRLILFGGPGPGGKAMANAPTLGLDGFCQKFLIWEDSAGITNLSFNNLLALAERQGAEKSIALRIIDFRLTRTFSDALAPN